MARKQIQGVKTYKECFTELTGYDNWEDYLYDMAVKRCNWCIQKEKEFPYWWESDFSKDKIVGYKRELAYWEYRHECKVHPKWDRWGSPQVGYKPTSRWDDI